MSEQSKAGLNQNFEVTAIDLLRKAASEYGDTLAVVSGSHRFTYRELNELTDVMAKKLVASGVKKGDNVGLLVHRSHEVAVGIYSIMKAGGAYVPLDFAYPEDRLYQMIDNAGIRVILVGKGLNLNGFAGVRIETADSVKDVDYDVHIALPDVTPDDRMALIYTSGSTGVPKGVRWRHRCPMPYAKYHMEMIDLKPGMTTLSYVGYSFAIHTVDYYPTVMAAATIHILPDEIRLDPQAISDYIDREKIYAALFPTSLGRKFIIETDNQTLCHMTVGGERFMPIPNAPKRHYTVYNGYGCTETCSVVLSSVIHLDQSIIPAGKAVTGMTARLMDESGNDVPQGEKGELVIQGPSVSAGYLNLPEKTASVFSGDAYHTGDIGVLDEEGQILVVGRKDFQVKIRGYRVELAEIDMTASECEGVGECVTIATEGVDSEYRLVTFVTPKSADVKAVKAYVSRKLPPYMVPSLIITLDALPKNNNGKIDRKSLPDPSEYEAEEYIAPETQTEKDLTKILSELLKLEADKLSAEADLFNYGLHSLLAVNLMRMIEEQFSVDVPSSLILKNPVIRDIAAAIDQLPKKTKQTHEMLERYPFSVEHNRYFKRWSANQEVSLAVPLYLVFSREDTDAVRLQQAVKDTLNNHSFLKATAEMDEKSQKPVWVRHEDLEPVVDICETTEEELNKTIKPDFYKATNLFGDPLYDATIYQTEKELHLLIGINHIAFDGASVEVFVHNIIRAYNGIELVSDKCVPFEVGMNEQVDEPKGIPFTHFLEQGEESGEQNISYKVIEAERVDKYAKENTIAPSAIFLSSLLKVLKAHAGNPDQIFISSEDSGRATADMMKSVGLFVRTLAPSFDTINLEPATVQRAFYDTVALPSFEITTVPSVNFLFSGSLQFGDVLEVNTPNYADHSFEMYQYRKVKSPFFTCDIDFQVTQFAHPQNGVSYYRMHAAYDKGKFPVELVNQLFEEIWEYIENMLQEK